MVKVAIIFSILGSVLYFGATIFEIILKKKNRKED